MAVVGPEFCKSAGQWLKQMDSVARTQKTIGRQSTYRRIDALKQRLLTGVDQGLAIGQALGWATGSSATVVPRFSMMNTSPASTWFTMALLFK
jgi:hypothetical protein